MKIQMLDEAEKAIVYEALLAEARGEKKPLEIVPDMDPKDDIN